MLSVMLVLQLVARPVNQGCHCYRVFGFRVLWKKTLQGFDSRSLNSSAQACNPH